MAAKTKGILGQYNIECSTCCGTYKNTEIQLGAETGLPYCYKCFLIENQQRKIVQPPVQIVPQPSNKPADKFITYLSPDE